MRQNPAHAKACNTHTLSGRLKASVLVELGLPEARALTNSSFCLVSSALRLKKVLEETEVDLVLMDEEAIEFTLRQRLAGVKTWLLTR